MRLGAAAVLLATAGCIFGGGSRYLDTDVCEVAGFTQLSAKDVQMSGGLLHTGTFEYSGSGDLKETFNDYVACMKDAGWAIASVEAQGDTATGALRKDTRSCDVRFQRQSGKILATVRVSVAK